MRFLDLGEIGNSPSDKGSLARFVGGGSFDLRDDYAMALSPVASGFVAIISHNNIPVSMFALCVKEEDAGLIKDRFSRSAEHVGYQIDLSKDVPVPWCCTGDQKVPDWITNFQQQLCWYWIEAA